jgi:HK97 family phage portal protein
VARKMFPALRRVTTETKVVTPVAFAQYYERMQGYGYQTTREWPIERAVTEGYDRVIWLFKGVQTLAADSSRLPFRLREGDDLDEGVVDDHPLYRVLNRRANPLETGQVFRKRLSSQIILSKKGAFVEVTKSNGGTIIRLDLLPPDRVQILPTKDGGVQNYVLYRRNGSVKVFEPDQIRWFRNPHPLDPFMGTTVLEPLGGSIELDHLSRMYNVTFMQNDGRPGGVLAVRAVDGSTNDIDPAAMTRVEEKFDRGPREAGKLAVIAGELSYVDLAVRPRDMQYTQTALNSKTEILSGLGIGESVMGWASGKTFDNADNELYVYWTRTQPEHQEIILDGFDEDSDDDLNGFFDTSKVEVLERNAKARRAEALAEFTAGLRSPISYAKLAGYEDEMDDTPQTRALYIAQGKTPLPSRAADAEALGMGAPMDTGGAPGGAPGAPGADPAALPPGQEPLALPPGPTGADNADGTQPAAIGAAPTPAALPPGASAAARRGAAAAALAAVAGTG